MSGLTEPVFDPLPLGAIKPSGWLHDQLRIQADGLTGHLDEHWADVGPDNGWLGGDGDGWERGPYYLDGLLPLAHLLGDERLIAKAGRWIDATLDGQRDDGSFGPYGKETSSGRDQSHDWWQFMIMLKVLTQHHEATGDERVIPFLERYAAHLERELPGRPLQSWARARGADLVLSILWLHRQRPDDRWLRLAELIMEQTLDWTDTFTDFPFRRKVTVWDPRSHGVNVAMGLRAPGLRHRVTGDPAQLTAVRAGLTALDTYHGQAHGLFSGDEWLSGTHPSQGLELCAVVEYLFSMEQLIMIFGEGEFGDLLELAAFNALPATISADWTSHQYDQQANQIACTVADRPWSNGPDANLFGLEPHFGCCTANMHQGWPKLVSHLWLSDRQGGLVAAGYAPCRVETEVADGIGLRLEVGGGYPFRETVTITLGLDADARFPLRLRIPGWCEKPSLSCNGEAVIFGEVDHGFVTVHQTWKDGDQLRLHLPMETRVLPRQTPAVAVERGPLVYALPIKEDWRPLRTRDRFSDWELHPASQWQFGIDEAADLTPVESEIGRQPFDAADAPIRLRTTGRLIRNWPMKHNSAAAPPLTCDVTDQPSVPLTLVPYGSARLRLTELPLLPP
ncbi:beta-L-arabinofuranosidase domain-containing protein [Microlunatus speluncae]|uniref:beta-L-arabinofuranosidase domain-containing protein n=1 Tax=Microlunatus speluncae TaxID=2594267 RepID=UPI0012668714|nr:beta-L-arabinofuranosidase domain-containing protein [Microlunatus speluncae]